jgi:hypothetical protein
VLCALFLCFVAMSAQCSKVKVQNSKFEFKTPR